MRRKFYTYNIYFVIFITLGLLLLFQQERFNYYGSFALYLPLLIVLDDTTKIYPSKRNFIKTCEIAFIMLCYIPAYNDFPTLRPMGGSFEFQVTKSMYPIINKICAIDPGLILADWGDGHFITYFSTCSITANPMIITAEDFYHIAENNRLMKLTAKELLMQNIYPIKYIYVRRNDNIFDTTSTRQLEEYNKGLRYELLFSTDLPREYHLVATLIGQDNLPIAKLYKFVF